LFANCEHLALLIGPQLPVFTGLCCFKRFPKRSDIGLKHGPQLFLKRRAFLSNAFLRLARKVFNSVTNSRLSLYSKGICIGHMIVLGRVSSFAKRHDPGQRSTTTGHCCLAR
jgi:hypothetical protein